MKKPIIETEIVREIPEMTLGGFLEEKNGELCLRAPDRMLRMSDCEFQITRMWHRAGSKPWNPLLYPLKAA